MSSKRGKRKQLENSSSNSSKGMGVGADQVSNAGPVDEIIRAAELDASDPADAKLQLRIRSYRETFIGEFVPPSLLRELEAAMPGSGQQVLDIVKERSAHRNKIESVQLAQAGAAARTAQFGGILIAVVGTAQFVYVITKVTSPLAMFASLVVTIASIGGPAVTKIIASRLPQYDAARNNSAANSSKKNPRNVS